MQKHRERTHYAKMYETWKKEYMLKISSKNERQGGGWNTISSRKIKIKYRINTIEYVSTTVTDN